MNKKFLLYIVIFLLLACSIIFTVKPENKNDDKKTVVFWTLQLSTFDKYINNIIAEFESENPDIKIKWIDVPYSEGEKRTLASVMTDNPPDLVNTTPDFSLLLARKKALYTIDEKDLKQFIPSLNNVLKYDGKYFGIPFYATSAVTLCNTELARKLKLKKLPETYDDLFNIPFKSDGNYFLTMINFAENDTLLKLLNKHDINTPDTINNAQSIEMFKKFKYLYDNNIVPKESITQTHRDALEKYMAGQLVFLVTGANFINMISENAPAVYKNTAAAKQLTGSTGKYDYSLMNFIIPLKAHNKEAALKFALFFTNKKNQLEFSKLTPVLPVNRETLEDEYFAAKTHPDLQTEARIISAEQLNNPQPPLSNLKNKKELNTLSANYIQDILINNSDIKETLDKFSLEWEKL